MKLDSDYMNNQRVVPGKGITWLGMFFIEDAFQNPFSKVCSVMLETRGMCIVLERQFLAVAITL